MEEEIKVSACKNLLCRLTLCLNGIFCLRCKLRVIYITVKVHTSSQASLTHATVIQARLKCFYRAKHTHIVHSGAMVGQVGLESRRGKVNASGSLPTVFCWATSCQAEEELVLLLPCSTYPTVGVNIVTQFLLNTKPRPRPKDLLL